MYTYAQYGQAEEAMTYAIYQNNQKEIHINFGRMDALLDLLRFYERLDEHNKAWSE